ncbi:hypothetical protein MKW94_007406 [Papaver nudicaule]|uniref:Cyclin N-terminal domain-containing protein n=1 Tax=Papaver nudicaule TaxID=74823 RepID=A0AA41SE95_PAPNU|nr:hypothetical protein [Papaver nudicaule]
MFKSLYLVILFPLDDHYMPVAGAAKQKIIAPGGNNRRALGDIGNLVNVRGVVGEEGKPLPNRPVTRSFVAQLLSKAQTADAAPGANIRRPLGDIGNNKKQIDGAQAKRAGVPKAVQKKVTVKPIPEVIDISPDTEEIKKEKPKSHHRSSKKKVHTLTSVLSARSKAACGITDRPKEAIIDIDGADANNHLAAVEYVEDLYKFYKLTEHSSMVHDYMDMQNQINGHMRMILVDWLIEVHNKFELTAETLYLTIHIVDRYLSMNLVARRELQLVGISAMLIASKYEEIWAPEVNDFVCISDKAYTREQILVMEKSILGKLGWTLTVPTPYHFLIRFVKAAVADKETENMTFFLAELGLMQYTMIKYCPSMLAASAVYAAHCTLKKAPLWNETLKLHTGFSEAQLIDCAKELVSFHSAAPEHKLRVVYRKYSSSERGVVALLPPANNLLA